jgi:hypothetical protein
MEGYRVNDKVEKVGKDESKFDWVTKRSECSLPKIYKTLRVEVEADVNTRNALRPANSLYEFLVEEHGSDFMVALKTKGVKKFVTFSLAEHAIVVRDETGNPMLEVRATFGDDGKCKLYVNEKERDLWQVRRMALEELLFQGK